MLIPIIKENPSQSYSISHTLMLKAGIIRQASSGMYIYLPLGLKIINNINNIIRTELNKIYAQEIHMPILQSKHLWDTSNRWNIYGKEMFKLKDRNNNDFCLGPTHEEIITNLISSHIYSYKQLPLILYQINTKFRDEIRPRSGLIRSREFLMKDAYSFCEDQKNTEIIYRRMQHIYKKIFKTCGLNTLNIEAHAGNIGGNKNHEIHALTKYGEDKIIICNSCGYIINYELNNLNNNKINNLSTCNKCNSHVNIKRSIEVGHIFSLNNKYSKAMNANIINKQGKQIYINMGCYGIGVSRTIAAIIEQNHDNQGIIWPITVTPFHVIILLLSHNYYHQCQHLYQTLLKYHIDVLFDDRLINASIKIKNANLIGYPIQVIIGHKIKHYIEINIRHKYYTKIIRTSIYQAPLIIKQIYKNQYKIYI